MLLQLLSLLGAAGLFLYGLNLLSAGLLKLSGDKFKTFLPWMRKNPVNSILAGFSITALAESSSAATVMVVGFVNAGALALSQAILVIMGANIGASFTAWLIAIFGFGLGITSIVYPFFALGFILTMSKGQKRKISGEVILGFALMFLGLFYMQKHFPATEALPVLKAYVVAASANGILSVLLFMAVGCVLAFGLQSTGAVTITMVMLGAGWIDFNMAAAMVMGENIGTTISANIAASEANIEAKRAALVHTLFNIFGAVLALIFFHPFIKMVSCIAGGLQTSWSCILGIAIFHTLFNLLDTCILAWFAGPIEKLVNLLVKTSEEDSEDKSRLIYISARHFGTPAISIAQAFKEVAHFASVLHEGFDNVKLAVNEKDPDEFEKYRMNLVQLEEISDRMEYHIAAFLNNVSNESISEEEADEIKVLYRIIGELESLGDSGENISRILERERVHNRKFDDDTIRKINLMIDVTDKAYKVMSENLEATVSGNVTDISNAYAVEDEINSMRNTLREQCVNQIEQHAGNYQSLNYFLDIISELEAMGDFMINVSQAIVRSED